MAKTIELLAQAGSPAALIALGINLFRFEVKGEKLTVVAMCALKLSEMPAVAFVLAKLLNLPPLAAGRRRAARADADRRERLHLCGPVSAAGEPGVGRGGAGHAAGGGNVAGGGGDRCGIVASHRDAKPICIGQVLLALTSARSAAHYGLHANIALAPRTATNGHRSYDLREAANRGGSGPIRS
ncbi:AEC family transporter [Bradyrhizobium manausense]|uniref:AEC family transporter n=1 Tax=Bradyrhizobium manausense TaxID=989370 RepID=UPI002011E3A0|nr:AEC family transporter [Bradyrhizobium manausense]